VTLLAGDPYLVRRRLAQLQNAAVGDPPPFGAIDVLHGDRAEVADVAVALKTLPLLGKRFVVLRQPERLREDAQKEIAALLDEIAPGTRFVLVSDSPDMRKTLFARLREVADVEILNVGSGRDRGRPQTERIELTARLATERGVSLSREALATLVEHVQGDVARTANELDKLSLRFGAEPIDPEKVRDSVGGERAVIAFALEGAVRERRIGRALAELRRALALGERPEVLVGQLASELRSLLRARALLDSGLDEQTAIREFGSGRGYYVVPQARRYRTRELVRALTDLSRVDVAAKRGEDAATGLEALLLQLRPNA